VLNILGGALDLVQCETQGSGIGKQCDGFASFVLACMRVFMLFFVFQLRRMFWIAAFAETSVLCFLFVWYWEPLFPLGVALVSSLVIALASYYLSYRAAFAKISSPARVYDAK